MKDEIKTRLVLIQAGKTPEGYKKTKAGIVPQNWEIKKLSDVLKKQTQKNTNNEIQNVLTNSATQGIVCQTDYFDKQIANNENTAGYYIVKPGYFVYNPRISVSAPCGPFNRYNGNEDGIMSPLYSVYCFCDKSLMYADFLTYYFSSSKWYAYMNSIANYGVRSDRMNVTGEDMNNMPIPYPPLPEQQRIVAILSAQDKIIELCGGEEYPEIRFKGFTDAWEQRKLGELGEVITGSTPSTSHEEYYSADGIPWVTPTDITENVIYDTPRKLSNEGQKVGRVVPKNTILVTCIASIGKNAILGTTGSFNQQINGLVPNFNMYVPYFLFTESIFWSEKMKRQAAAGTMQIVNKTEFSELETSVPNYKEQEKIGAFFSNLDNLITLHQRKCEEEKKKKKALQQLLLTGIVRINYE